MAIDARALLDVLADLGIRPGDKLNGKKARLVATHWLPLAGWKPDNWGNYKHPDKPTRRIVVTDRSFKIQSKRHRGWGMHQTYSLIDWSTGRMVKLAERAGTEAQKQRAGHARDQRQSHKKGAVDKRRLAEVKEVAQGRLNKAAMVELRDQGLLPGFARGGLGVSALNPVLTPFLASDRLQTEMDWVSAYRSEHDGWPPGDDGDHWSLAAPPYPFLPGTPAEYAWEENGYTVTIGRRRDTKRNAAEWMIGATGGVLGFDPLRFTLRAQGVDRKGDGYAAGIIQGVTSGAKLSKGKQGDPIVMLTMIGARTKKKGTGRRLMAKVRDLVTGYGRNDFYIEAITSEGQSFFDHLVSVGELEEMGRTRTGGRYRFAGVAKPKRKRAKRVKPQAPSDLLDRLLAQIEGGNG